jgi:hypothetical protein
MYTTQPPSRETLIATLLTLTNDPLPNRPPPLPTHSRRALLPEIPNWYWVQTATVAVLQSTHALEMTPFTPATLVSLSTVLTSIRIVHTLFFTQPHKSTRPFYALLPGGSDAVAFAIGQIIEDIAKRFSDTYPLYVLRSSHSNNRTSIAQEGNERGTKNTHT